jgi:site-specific DNA-methyltransferase (adenine-specific)
MDRLLCGDCRSVLPLIEAQSVDLVLSDIPYGINLDVWDVIHNNMNSALLGTSPAQAGKSGFKRRGKPLNGWSKADRNAFIEYQRWCETWVPHLFRLMKPGASMFLFGARRTLHRVIVACEDSGFVLRDILVWRKQTAHHRAAKASLVFDRRGDDIMSKQWVGWRVGNLAPIYEPIAWFFKPYETTIADNLKQHALGAMNMELTKVKYGVDNTNVLSLTFEPKERRYHEAQKPVRLLEYLIELTTLPGQLVLDPFAGSGSTAVAAKNIARRYVAIEIDPSHVGVAQSRLING